VADRRPDSCPPGADQGAPADDMPHQVLVQPLIVTNEPRPGRRRSGVPAATKGGDPRRAERDQLETRSRTTGPARRASRILFNGHLRSCMDKRGRKLARRKNWVSGMVSSQSVGYHSGIRLSSTARRPSDGRADRHCSSGAPAVRQRSDVAQKKVPATLLGGGHLKVLTILRSRLIGGRRPAKAYGRITGQATSTRTSPCTP